MFTYHPFRKWSEQDVRDSRSEANIPHRFHFPSSPSRLLLVSIVFLFVVLRIPATAVARSEIVAQPELRTVAEWESLFLSRWNAEHVSDFLPRSQSLDSWQYYNLGYAIDANTAMYRATGNTQYLDRALLYVNNVVNNAQISSSLPDSQFQDSYLGWASQRSDTRGLEVPLFESYCWRYVTRMLRVMRETPELYNDPAYRTQYDHLLAFTETNIFEKWHQRGANSYIYRSRTHMAAHWAYIAMDLSQMTTDDTRRAAYLTVFDNINHNLPNYPSSLRQQLEPHPVDPAGYFWSAVWGSHAYPGQDVAHGNGVLAYIVEAHDAGMAWTDADIDAFLATFNVIWPAAGPYAQYVDGSGNGNGWFNDGWIKLARYDADMQQRLESHTVGRNTQLYGNGALNAWLLSNPPSPPPDEPTLLPVQSVAASSDDGNGPQNTLDDDLSTRWSAWGDGEWIQYDLGNVATVSYLDVAFFVGDQRTAAFDVQVSADGSTWTTVLAGATSSGTTNGLQTFDFADAPGRYVRIIGHGNANNLWNSLTEVDIYGFST